MYRLVIFDLDDTLLTLGVSWDAVKKDVLALARQEGIILDPGQHLVILCNSLSNSPDRKKAVDAIFLKHETACTRAKNYVAFPDMLTLVGELKASGRQVAIASGNHTSTIKQTMSDLEALGSFDCICGRDSVDRNKPAPDQLDMILERLAVRKEDVIFVGDSINDAAAAKSAGIAYFKIRPGNESDIRALRKLLSL
jgi:phosphoglycolate phosphatase-like HAD superfamily hydrolase